MIMKKVGVSYEEKQLPYFQYFQRDMAPVPQKKMEILRKGPMESGECLPFSQRQQFLAGTDRDYSHCGYGTAEDGTGFVANETYMPGVRGEMLDWWFPWHSVGSDLRYKIWDPEDHYFARADRADYVCSPEVPMRQKTWGVTHYVLEDIGAGPGFLKLHFKRPSELGYDEKVIGSDFCSSLVCAAGEGTPAVMTHKWYSCQDGVLFCSRFWVGLSWEKGKACRVLPKGIRVPEEVLRGLFAHNIKEFSNLGAILPAVYEEEKNFL